MVPWIKREDSGEWSVGKRTDQQQALRNDPPEVREVAETDSDALDEWFCRQVYNSRDTEHDLILANGDYNWENLRRVGHARKVRRIEEDFHRLMFDVEDV